MKNVTIEPIIANAIIQGTINIRAEDGSFSVTLTSVGEDSSFDRISIIVDSTSEVSTIDSSCELSIDSSETSVRDEEGSEISSE